MTDPPRQGRRVCSIRGEREEEAGTTLVMPVLRSFQHPAKKVVPTEFQIFYCHKNQRDSCRRKRHGGEYRPKGKIVIEVKAPGDYKAAVAGRKSIFLAGSIEMGKAENWQERICSSLKHMDVALLNPRRLNWNSTWEQSVDNPDFREQVEWELSALEAADLIVMYFVPETRSPVTLLELGIHAATSPEKLIVCCPEGYWRRGNVDIVCRKFGVRQVPTLSELVRSAVSFLQQEA
jgi:hypothetical protein